MNLPDIATDLAALRIPREVTALIAALQLREPDTELLETLSDQEWTSLLTFCDLAHLTLPLTQLPTTCLPPSVVERLRTNVADNALRFERVKATYKEAADALDRAGVEHIVIKGFTQSPDYVQDPRLRAQSDLDLYCPPEMIASAQLALQAIGYAHDDLPAHRRADHIPGLIRPGSWQWKGNPFDPEMPLSIELHFCLWNTAVTLIPIPEINSFWERRTHRVVDGLHFQSLSPADHLGYLALHVLRGVLARDWVIHHVRELAVFLHAHANDDAFWKSWSETHSPQLRSIEAISFYYAQAWFGCQIHTQAETEVACLSPKQKSWLHHFVGSALEVMFAQNKDSFWLHLTLLNSTRARLMLIKQLFVPSHISSVKSPAVQFENRRRRGLSGVHPYKQYMSYLASRGASYTNLSLTAILRGVRWRLSRHQLAPQFWIFLAASFFLTWACPFTSSSSISF